MSEETYNGWSNYQTWVVNLWIDNDQGTSEFWNERASEIYQESKPEYDWDTQRDVAKRALANEIEESFRDEADNALPHAGPLTDLLGSALDRVNWREIAEGMIDNAIAELPDDDMPTDVPD